MAEQNVGPLKSGARVGRFEVVSQLGEGGMGAVYEVRDGESDARYALKALHKDLAKNETVRARFVREGRASQRLQHPHVVEIVEVGTQEEVPYLVMEKLEGETLNDLLRRERPLTVERTADLMVPVCAAVAAAHDAGIIHRDLKPANIFLAKGADGRTVPKLLDFGISKVEEEEGALGLTATASALGTPLYTSPEQARDAKRVDPRSDQYALGVILYECATGRRAFRGDALFAWLRGAGKLTPPREHRPELPEDLAAAIVRAMRFNADERFPSVRELGRALLPFASPEVRARWQGDFAPEPPPKPEAPPEPEAPPKPEPESTAPSTIAVIAASAVESAATAATPVMAPVVTPDLPAPPTESAPPRRAGRSTWLAALAAVAVLVAIYVLLRHR